MLGLVQDLSDNMTRQDQRLARLSDRSTALERRISTLEFREVEPLRNIQQMNSASQMLLDFSTSAEDSNIDLGRANEEVLRTPIFSAEESWISLYEAAGQYNH